MSLLSSTFVAFVALAWLAHLRAPRRARSVILLVVSVLFYGWVHPWFAVVLVGSAAWSHATALAIRKYPERKLLALRVGLAGSAAVLLGFRAAGFYVDEVSAALGTLGVDADPRALGFAVPAGLSFYVLMHASYPIDVYWGKFKLRADAAERTGWLDWLTVATFFPLLLAGPIERVGRLLPQVEKDRVVDGAAVRAGLSLVAWGAFQKVVLADTLAPYVGAVAAVEHPAPILSWAAAVGFLVQMLVDFSGYANLARGVARLFGFQVIANFDHPYLARTPAEFWTRWHISLSEWLRDYIFFPTYRSAFARRWLPLPQRLLAARHHDSVRATVATMVVSGLWHGIGWNFLLWGSMWAAAMIAQQVVTPHLDAKTTGPGWRLARSAPVQLGAMWAWNVLAHQVFREPTFAQLIADLTSAPWAGTVDDRIAATVILGFTGVAIAVSVGALWV
ncbi:MAG: MBOAT family O-acyltransferase, partial [Myxococcota bacterium]